MKDYQVTWGDAWERVRIMVIILVAAALLLAGKLAWIQLVRHQTYSAMVNQQSSIELPLIEVRGDILDRNFKKIVNQQKCSYFYISKDAMKEQGISLLMRLTASKEGESYKKVGTVGTQYDIYQVTGLTTREIQMIEEYYQCVSVSGFKRYSQNQIAAHLVGYVNKADNEGVYGLEKAYRYILGKQPIKAYAKVDAKGKIIPWMGIEEVVRGNMAVVTNLDYGIQQKAESILAETEIKGAIIVLDGATGQLLACASWPGFDPNLLESYLDSSKSELVNLGIQGQYPPGSIFKIVVAAAALESGIATAESSFECKGHQEINGVKIRCFTGGEAGHGWITLEDAFANSCNSTFIQLGQQLGPEKILEMAEKMGLGQKVMDQLYEESTGKLTAVKDTAGAGIGNLSIGQGDLLITPLQAAQLVQIIVNNGAKAKISLVKGFIDIDRKKDEGSREIEDGISKEIASVDATAGNLVQVISEDTAAELQRMMEKTVETGTASSLMNTSATNPSLRQMSDMVVGGKTGSAQSSLDGKAVVHGWFTGFIILQPREGTENNMDDAKLLNVKSYAISIFTEDGKSGSKTCVPMFQKMLDYFRE